MNFLKKSPKKNKKDKKDGNISSGQSEDDLTIDSSNDKSKNKPKPLSVPSSASKGLTSFKVNMKLCPTEKMTQQELLELERDAKDLTARPPQDLMQKFNEYKSKASQVQGVAQKMQQMKNLQKGGSDILEKKLDKLRETLGK